MPFGVGISDRLWQFRKRGFSMVGRRNRVPMNSDEQLVILANGVKACVSESHFRVDVHRDLLG